MESNKSTIWQRIREQLGKKRNPNETYQCTCCGEYHKEDNMLTQRWYCKKCAAEFNIEDK